MKNPYMKFQNISKPGSKIMLCTRKRDERMNTRMNERTTSQKQYAPNFFQSRRHNKQYTVKPQ